MSADSSSNVGGICVLAIPGLIGVALVVLKLNGFVWCSWWWVTAPFWEVGASAAVVLAIKFMAIPARRFH